MFKLEDNVGKFFFFFYSTSTKKDNNKIIHIYTLSLQNKFLLIANYNLSY